MIRATTPRITAQYDGWTQNFVVICGEAITVLEFLGTDERSVHYEGHASYGLQ